MLNRKPRVYWFKGKKGQEDTNMTIWEYKVDTEYVEATAYTETGKLKADPLEEYLNKQGEAQWEFITFIPGNPNEGTVDLFIFKRPKRKG